MNRPIPNLVSVVIPVHNGRRFVDAALHCALAQSHAAVEVIVVDDGSTDDSCDIVRGYGSPVRLIEQPNRGVGHARNTGVEHARGEFVAFLDQDDWWREDKLEHQVQIFRSSDRIGLAHTGVDYFDEPSQAFTTPLNPAATSHRLVGDCYDELLLENHVRNSSVLVRAAVLRAAGTCSPEVCGNTVQDYDLWLRIARVSQFAYLPEPLTIIRLHHAQGTWDRRQMLTEEARLLERVAADRLRVGALTARMASLYDALGVAHLDAGEASAARRWFRRSLGYQMSWRDCLLWMATFMPHSARERFRQTRATLKGAEIAPAHLDRFASKPSNPNQAPSVHRAAHGS